MHKSILLLSLLLVQGVAVAAPPSKNNDGVKLSTDDIKLDINWDQKEYDWWQSNCRDLGIGDSRIQLNCDKMDGKYRDHYNRSIHSGNNPGKGHDKNDWDNNDNGKYKEKGNGKGKNK